MVALPSKMLFSLALNKDASVEKVCWVILMRIKEFLDAGAV